MALTEFTSVNGIDLSLHLPGHINVAEIIPMLRRSHVRYLQSSIELAAALHTSHITVHIGTFYWFPVRQRMRRKALDRFLRSMDKTIIPYLEQSNVCLALENVVPIPYGSEYLYLGDNLDDFDYLFKRLPATHFKFCLDTGHANLAEGVLPYIHRMGHRMITVHYHDNKGTNDDHLPVGDGTIDWQSIADELSRIEYSGPIISECRLIRPHESADRFRAFFQTRPPNTLSLKR